jgi:hypothetical protein
MRKPFTLLWLAIVSMSFHTLHPDCESLIFFKEGTKTTMTYYNDDGKVTGSAKTTYKKVEKIGPTTMASATQENYDKKGKLASSTDFTIKCENGSLLFDMKLMMPQQQAESFKDLEMTVDGADKEIPSDLSAGSVLKDAQVKFSFKSKSGMAMPMMNVSVWITDRKVEGKESVTTSAGTFDCFKITENVEVKTILKVKTKTASWFSNEAGVVKTESYKDNGKLVGKSELTELIKK